MAKLQMEKWSWGTTSLLEPFLKYYVATMYVASNLSGTVTSCTLMQAAVMPLGKICAGIETDGNWWHSLYAFFLTF